MNSFWTVVNPIPGGRRVAEKIDCVLFLVPSCFSSGVLNLWLLLSSLAVDNPASEANKLPSIATGAGGSTSRHQQEPTANPDLQLSSPRLLKMADHKDEESSPAMDIVPASPEQGACPCQATTRYFLLLSSCSLEVLVSRWLQRPQDKSEAARSSLRRKRRRSGRNGYETQTAPPRMQWVWVLNCPRTSSPGTRMASRRAPGARGRQRAMAPTASALRPPARPGRWSSKVPPQENRARLVSCFQFYFLACSMWSGEPAPVLSFWFLGCRHREPRAGCTSRARARLGEAPEPAGGSGSGSRGTAR